MEKPPCSHKYLLKYPTAKKRSSKFPYELETYIVVKCKKCNSKLDESALNREGVIVEDLTLNLKTE